MKTVISLLLALLMAVGGAAGQTMAEADALWEAQDWEGAARAYAAVVAADPGNAAAWFRLGQARHQAGDYRGAAEAWQTAEAAGYVPPLTRYNLASAHARLGNLTAAFQWLERAVAAGFNRLQILEHDPDLAPLRDDARFAVLKEAVERNARPCAFDENRRQFDFWVGTWDVTNADGRRVGTNTIRKIQGDCVLQENWTGASGGTGTSFNFYDPSTGRWHQVWVDSSGHHARFEGGYHDGAMRFEGTWVTSDGTTSRMIMTFTPLEDGRVRQLIEQSTDGGQTYTVWFDGYYARSGS